MLFTKATREKAKLRMALTGVSGAGKTLSALYIAYGLTEDWSKIALIDTEHSRAKFYANRTDLHTGSFLHAAMEPPFTPDKYKQYMKEAVQVVGANGVVIVDSFSHAWEGEGGVLAIKEQIAARINNSYTAWNEAGKVQNELVSAILSADCHTIVTMRAKTQYAMEENDRGKMQPVKIGLAPIQRENTEYEFDVVLWLNRADHVAYASKDTTFLDRYGAVITPELGRQLKAWLDEGEDPVRCEACGQVLKPTKTKTIQQLAEGTKEKAGKVMCTKCFNAWFTENVKAGKQCLS